MKPKNPHPLVTDLAEKPPFWGEKPDLEENFFELRLIFP